MKKIAIFLTPILIFAIAFGCSKDHNAPTNTTYKALSNPDSLEATYSPSKDEVIVSWTMNDTSGVYDFFVSVSDSNVFDLGETRGFFTNLEPIAPPFSYIYDASLYVAADVDSLILYFTVSAVFKNDNFNGFIGPRAEIDSALVLRK